MRGSSWGGSLRLRDLAPEGGRSTAWPFQSSDRGRFLWDRLPGAVDPGCFGGPCRGDRLCAGLRGGDRCWSLVSVTARSLFGCRCFRHRFRASQPGLMSWKSVIDVGCWLCPGHTPRSGVFESCAVSFVCFHGQRIRGGVSFDGRSRGPRVDPDVPCYNLFILKGPPLHCSAM